MGLSKYPVSISLLQLGHIKLLSLHSGHNNMYYPPISQT